ncbi:PACE efflux transporter [Azoarcus sp. L1K30]|uniref:PACE efflux transporter n=1 Tax=Azoarcus sp. L1K30 TaxID=2820277 RepID=UPI001B819808|nr:PACE efflux transporter [Azoarcus sp. L1K30]
MSAKHPKLRSLRDRLRQILLFELGGLLLITPPFAWASGVPIAESAGLLAVLALVAALWNAGFNTLYDWIEGRMTGRTADRRPFALRCVHAILFEGGLLMLTLPVLMLWTGLDWWAALIADIGVALAYTFYALLFNLGYDRLFPIAADRTALTRERQA